MKLRMSLWLFIIFLVQISNVASAETKIRSIFPLDNYPQNVDLWIKPSSPTYNQPLLSESYQKARFYELKHSYFGTTELDNSPWSSSYVNYLLNSELQKGKTIYAGEALYLKEFNNQDKESQGLYYAMNYRVHFDKWIQDIANNLDLEQFRNISYNPQKRSIATDNLLVRVLPTSDPAFLNDALPGNGYPFDLLQASAIFIGTPLYILGTTKDLAWSLVLSPAVIGWVNSSGLAKVDQSFIRSYQKAAYTNLGAITQTGVSLIDKNKQFLAKVYIGTILPIKTTNPMKVMLPIKQSNAMASIKYINVDSLAIKPMPLTSTPANFAELFKQLILRPYGWGNIGLYNDCSAETKAIYTTFGIFLPRNSASQLLAGRVMKLNTYTLQERLAYLNKYGQPFFTLIHINGHIMLYIGSYKDKSGKLVPVVYEDMWGLGPRDRSRRAVVGGSVFLPLVTQFPEDPALMSQADYKLFELVYLNQLPEQKLKLSLSEILY